VRWQNYFNIEEARETTTFHVPSCTTVVAMLSMLMSTRTSVMTVVVKFLVSEQSLKYKLLQEILNIVVSNYKCKCKVK